MTDENPVVSIIKWAISLLAVAFIGSAAGIFVGSRTKIPEAYKNGIIQYEPEPQRMVWNNDVRNELEAIDLKLITIDGRVIVIEGLVDKMRIAREREDAVKEYIESQKH